MYIIDMKFFYMKGKMKMKRNILTIILVLLLILAIALPVLAVDTGAQTETDNTYATAADNTKSDCLKSDSLKPEITIDDEHNITMTYSAAALKTVAADESQNRPIEAAWIGFKLTTPTEATKYNVTYKGQTSSGNITDSTVEDFVAVTADKLKEVTQAKTNLVYTKRCRYF